MALHSSLSFFPSFVRIHVCAVYWAILLFNKQCSKCYSCDIVIMKTRNADTVVGYQCCAHVLMSVVWRYFGLGDDDKSKAVFKLCSAKLSRGEVKCTHLQCLSRWCVPSLFLAIFFFYISLLLFFINGLWHQLPDAAMASSAWMIKLVLLILSVCFAHGTSKHINSLLEDIPAFSFTTDIWTSSFSPMALCTLDWWGFYSPGSRSTHKAVLGLAH